MLHMADKLTRDGLILPGIGTASGFPPSKFVRISAMISNDLPRPMSSASIPNTQSTTQQIAGQKQFRETYVKHGTLTKSKLLE